MKNTLLSLVLSGVAIAPGGVMADPTNVSLYIACPETQPGWNMITNFGNYIAGFGMETVFSTNIPVYFKSTYMPSNTPNTLINYGNSSIEYDSTTGIVTCNYSTNVASNPVFSVSYTITNGKGGALESVSNKALSLIFPVGLKG